MSIGVGASTAQIPLQKNFGSLKKYVAAYVQGANLTAVLSDAGEAINSTIDLLNNDLWGFLLKTQTITPLESIDTYTLNTDFKSPRTLMRLDSNNRPKGRIGYLDPKEFEDLHPYSPSDTTPSQYTVHNATEDLLLTLNHKPSAGFVTLYPTLRLRYYARMLHFADDGDVIGDLGAPPELWSFLGWGGRAELAAIRGGDFLTADKMVSRRLRALIRSDSVLYSDVPTDYY